jgi:hypothetical protein
VKSRPAGPAPSAANAAPRVLEVASAACFLSNALNNDDLPTLGKPTIPTLKFELDILDLLS